MYQIYWQSGRYVLGSFARRSTGGATILSPFGCLLARTAQSNRNRAPRRFAIIFSITTVIIFVRYLFNSDLMENIVP